MVTTQPVSTPPAGRRFALISGGRSARGGRETAVRRAREARRQLQPRHERFAHLKRSYD